MSKHRKINGQFAPRTIEMLRSPAMRALSLSGHRILDRIEIELASHGGRDNGRLPVTFANFEEHGIERHAISRGIRQVCALGFVELTRRGHAGGGEFRTPNLFRITYLPAYGKAPTHEWRQIETVEEAEKIARKFKRTIKEKHFPGAQKATDAGGKKPPDTRAQKATVAPDSPVRKKPPLSRQGSSHLRFSGTDQGLHSTTEPPGAPRTRGPMPFVNRTNQKGGHNGKGE